MNSKLHTTVITAFLASGLVQAEPQISGKFTVENAQYTSAGTTIGDSVRHSDSENFKNEIAARIYVDGEMDFNEGSSYHVELQGFKDSKANDNNKNNEDYTQRDALREAYVDTNVGDWLVRAGKQQVVWGTADGMKLLDLVNPTDFTEMAQNQMEDSRIPVWMLNADRSLDDGGNFQFIVSQPRENVFCGFDRNISTTLRSNNLATGGDLTTAKGHGQGCAFTLKGVDTITGKSNGFLNIVPDLGSIAYGFSNNADTLAGTTVGSLRGFTHYSLNAFAQDQASGFGINANGTLNTTGSLDGAEVIAGFAAGYDTNLSDNAKNAQNWKAKTNPGSTFEYMGRTVFATFDAFANALSQYKYDMPENDEFDIAMRYKNTTESGTNYSFNYSYNYDKNPVVDLAWKNQRGETLTVNKDTTTNGFGAGAASAVDSAYLYLTDSNSQRYGFGKSPAILEFKQSLKRAHNIGASMDTTVETETLGPVVLRAEALYQKDVYSPIMDRGALDIGDLVSGLKMQKGDKFKYVLGADITALTNMMVSVQFIQERNLDYIDQKVDWDGTACTAADGVNCGRYTADFATMHLTNGLNKAEENKEFVSLYLSKPFGESGQHRWNNITIFEENGGKWNRLDVEYTIDDNTIATAEYNNYWGNENTQFGQLSASSNIQLGLKYSF